jgi:hypothetical protein
MHFLCVAALGFLLGCNESKTHQIFYGATPRPVVSITIGTVTAVKPLRLRGLRSASMISPDRLAIIKMDKTLKGPGVGERIRLAYEAGRHNAPVTNSTYVFLWDEAGNCIRYFSLVGDFYLKDDRQTPLADLMKE